MYYKNHAEHETPVVDCDYCLMEACPHGNMKRRCQECIDEAERAEIFGSDTPEELADLQKAAGELPALSPEELKKKEAETLASINEEAEKLLTDNVKTVPMNPWVIRLRFGFKKPFRKGVLVDQLLPKFKAHVLDEVRRIHGVNGSPKMVTGQPFVLTLLVREAFLVGLNDSEHPAEWRAASSFEEGKLPEVTVEAAFEDLKVWALEAEKGMDPVRSYACEFYAKWLWEQKSEKVKDVYIDAEEAKRAGLQP